MKKLLLSISLSIGLASSIEAQTLGVQFWASSQSPNDAALSSSQTAGVVPQDHFNVVEVSDLPDSGGTAGTFPLVNSAGASTGASLTIGNNNDAYYTGTSTSTPNGTLLSGQSGSYSNSSPVTYTFNGLQAGTYDLIVYTVTNTTGDNGEFSLVNGTTTGSANLFDIEQNGADFDGTFIPSSATTKGAATTANYVEFTGVTPNSGTVEISLPNQGFLYVDAINGFQLVEVPEPPAVFMAGAAALVLLGLAWRNRAACRS